MNLYKYLINELGFLTANDIMTASGYSRFELVYMLKEVMK